jgi:cobalt/nickel transport system permease protein
MFLAMHIPDGFLTLPVSAVGWLLAATLLAVALRVSPAQVGERQVPLLGVLAAFVFAAQSINFPVAGGTSGHLLGGTLVAIVLGPWAAALVMTAVIATQGLLFQDGGLVVMGWNLLNMGIFTAFSGYATYVLVRRMLGPAPWAQVAAAFVAAWLSVEIGAIACSFELAASGSSPLALALPAMTGVHAFIGIGEALITAGAVALLQKSRPDLLESGSAAPGQGSAGLLVGGLAVALLVALCSPLACSAPDGLDRVAQLQGFAHLESAPLWHFIPDYKVGFIAQPVLASMLGVVLGTLVVFALGLAVGRATARHAA